MGASREEGRDMAGLHPSKGCRGQTFSCPWPRTPGGAGLMAARSKRLALPGQKPASSWKMWIVGLLCLGPGAMRSEKTDLCWKLDCVWTLSLSKPVGRADGVVKKKNHEIKRQKKKHHQLSEVKKELSHRDFSPLKMEEPRRLFSSSNLNWQEIECDKTGVLCGRPEKVFALVLFERACDVKYYSPSRLFGGHYIFIFSGVNVLHTKMQAYLQKRRSEVTYHKLIGPCYGDWWRWSL